MKTKQEILAKCKEILNTNPLYRPLKEDDYRFMASVLINHPCFKEKTAGKNIKAIIVKDHPRYHSRQFALVLEDGVVADISYIESVNRSFKENIKEACGDLIKDIVRPEIDLGMVVREWLKGFDLGELTIGLYLVGNHFENPALINNFRTFYSQIQ